MLAQIKRTIFCFAWVIYLIFQPVFAAPTTANKILVISDIHFSPFADCPNNLKACPLITKLNQADAAQWPTLLAQYSSQKLPANGHVTNYALIRSMLSEIKRQQPENLLLLGDFLAHRYRSQYIKYSHDHNRSHYNQFIAKTLQFLTKSIQQNMPPNGVIYPVIGNNDSYGGQGCPYPDYCTIPNGQFFADTTRIWAGLLGGGENKTKFTATFPRAGYYESILPNSNNHLIALNTVLFSQKAHGPDIDSAAQ